MTTIQRPALGQIGSLGGLYDAATDTFLRSKLSGDQLPLNTIQTLQINKEDVIVTRETTLKHRLDALGVGSDLSASILASFLDLTRSGRMLSDHDMATRAMCFLIHTSHSVTEKLKFQAPQFKAYLDQQTHDNPSATHLVVGIDWGAVNVFCFHSSEKILMSTEEERDEVHSIVCKWAAKLKSQNSGQPTSQSILSLDKNGVALASLLVYSDVLIDGNIILDGLQEAEEFVRISRMEVRGQNDGKGQPIAYSILPLETVRLFLGETTPSLHIPTVSPEAIRFHVDLLDRFQAAKRQVLQHNEFTQEHRKFLPTDSIEEVERAMNRLGELYDGFLPKVGKVIKSVRGGLAGSEELLTLARKFEGENSPENIAQFDRFGHEVLIFLGAAAAEGAIYLGYNSPMLDEQLTQLCSGEAYVLSFGRAFMREQIWADAQILFWKMLTEKKDAKFVMLDCDAISKPLESPLISHYKNSREVVHDLLDQELFNLHNCVARCDSSLLEKEKVEKPARRRFLKIPCPGANCSGHPYQEWKCQRCMDPLEFGFVDDFIYCQCGRSRYSNYRFKCNQPSHGLEFAQYDSTKLQKLLQTLDTSNYINILILGETGVGKSTFINALVNYLQFATLDEALLCESLNWVIPSSFSLQTMNRNNPDEQIREQKIKVGDRIDEVDSTKGESATQQTAVYPVHFENEKGMYTVRLIDTPGIGDTRGVEYDKKNMADILLTLKSYDELHGILILLKSNAARLTITFQYCVKELLTHLHQSAAQNMVFGFTNTRISNYTPGDTFVPLKALLSKNRDVGLALSTHTTYCFDSESFRYLAACKNGVQMPNKQDFDSSWNHSREETMRLMDHFQSIGPHQVKSTLSLNGIRESIKSLTKPMAEISQKIKHSIDVVEDTIKEVADTKATGDKLKSKLRIKKIQMNAVPLDKPRTVCADTSCVEIRDDGKGQNTPITVYKTHCHKECYLDNVAVDVQAAPGLISCYAFGGQDKCNNCGHHWQQHLHVLYELEEETVEVNDASIQQKIQSNANDLQLKNTAITSMRSTITEYKAELQKIHEAAAKFGFFLKNNSITPYNDATKSYLEFLIKDERGKVETVKGASRKRLDSLEEDLKRHLEAVKILDSSMHDNSNRPDLTIEAIDREIQALYSLKHFGQNLQTLQSSIAQAHDATNRERPHMIRRNRVGPRKLEIRFAGDAGPNHMGPSQSHIPWKHRHKGGQSKMNDGRYPHQPYHPPHIQPQRRTSKHVSDYGSTGPASYSGMGSGVLGTLQNLVWGSSSSSTRPKGGFS